MKNKIQIFNGKVYYKYQNEKYFTKGTSKLHRDVWEYHNGKIKKGYHIHHKDFNKENNNINNLELLSAKDHSAIHENNRDDKFIQKRKEHLENIRPLTKIWHKSDEGKEWHKKHAKDFNFGHKEYGKRICDICNKEYIAKSKNQKYCSGNCKSKARLISGVDNINAKCEYCNNDFIKNKYTKIRFCSKSCSAKHTKRKCN